MQEKQSEVNLTAHATGARRKKLTRLGAQSCKHTISDPQSFSTLSATSVGISRRRSQFGPKELDCDVLPAVGVDAARNDESMGPHLVIESEPDSFATFTAEEESRHLVKVGGTDSVGDERSSASVARGSRGSGSELIGCRKGRRIVLDGGGRC
jgi:hypothetical protein